MNRVWLLGWWWWAGAWLVAAPIDLQSPFSKTALVEGTLGKTEEFEIRQAKLVGDSVEMVKLDESLLLAPRSKVLAILPKLPPKDLPYTQQDARQALAFLQEAQQGWPDRPETSARTLTVWKELADRPSTHEQKLDSQRAREAEQWLGQIQPEEGKPTPIDLQAYVREGERLTREGGPKAEQVRRQLEKVQNLMAMDLREVRGKELPTDWAQLGLGIPVAIAAMLLLLAGWVFLNLSNFSTALKAGNIRTSARGGESQTTLNLKGVVYLVYALLGGTLLYFLLQPLPWPTPASPSAEAEALAERALYLSMNTSSRWSSQSKSSLTLEASAAVAALQKILPQGEFRMNSVVAFSGPEAVWSEGEILWRQTVKLAFLPVRLDFRLQPAAGSFLLENPPVDGLRVGQIPLGGFLARLIWGRFQEVTSSWDRALGLQSGAVWSWEPRGQIQVQTPQVLGSKEEKKLADLAGRGKAQFKESISARELAEVFAQGDGEVFLNRTIQLTGKIKSVSSMRRLGNTFTSEMARAALTKTGGAEAVQAVAPTGQEDEPDAFLLDTVGQGLDSKIQVKVLVKSPEVYYLDGRGDLYRVGANPNVDAPVIPRQKEVLFKGGRVEGMERNVIEVYGAQPPVEAP